MITTMEKREIWKFPYLKQLKSQQTPLILPLSPRSLEIVQTDEQ